MTILESLNSRSGPHTKQYDFMRLQDRAQVIDNFYYTLSFFELDGHPVHFHYFEKSSQDTQQNEKVIFR